MRLRLLLLAAELALMTPSQERRRSAAWRSCGLGFGSVIDGVGVTSAELLIECSSRCPPGG